MARSVTGHEGKSGHSLQLTRPVIFWSFNSTKVSVAVARVKFFKLFPNIKMIGPMNVNYSPGRQTEADRQTDRRIVWNACRP